MKTFWLFIITVLYIISLIHGKKHLKHKHGWKNHTKSNSNNSSRSMDSKQSCNNKLKKNTENKLMYEYIRKKVRILCMVMTHPANHKTRALHVRTTWGKRCNKLVFFSTMKDRILKTVKLSVDYHNELNMSRAAFSYAYEYCGKKIDWFLKVYDDTYVVVENLRYLLAQYSPTMLITFSEEAYIRSAAGYVLSRAALERLVTEGTDIIRCPFHGSEDYEMSKCLNSIGVQLINSRDHLLRGRLFPVPLHEFYNLIAKADFYFWDGNFFATDKGLDWCSDELITLKTKQPKDMYVVDYLIYGLRPHRLTSEHNTNVWQDWQAQRTNTLKLRPS